MKTRLLLLVLFYVLPASAIAEDLELINRPVNASGLSGLLFTTGPFTVPSRSIELGVAALAEKSSVPDYTNNEIPSLTITFGINNNMEAALRGSYVRQTIEKGIKKRGPGDTEFSYKWNFLPQSEDSIVPALALFATGIAGTSSKAVNFRGISDWGARFGLSAGREILWGDHVIDIYADGQLVVQDLSDAEVRDRYGMINAGLLFPISKYRNLQMLLEYNMVTGIDRITAEGGDYSTITYGLRLVTEGFNLSIGTQFLHKQPDGFADSSRLIGMMSLKM